MAKKVHDQHNAKRDNAAGYAFLSPWIIGLIIFSLVPILLIFIFSFTTIKHSINGYEFSFVGFSNYTSAFLGNTDFTLALLQFLAIEITYVPIIIIISFIIAIFLNMKLKGQTFFRTVFFLPVIILSGPLLTMLFKTPTLTDEAAAATESISLSTSIIYRMLAQYSRGLAKIVSFVYDNFVMLLWFTGIPIILFINGLQKINKNIYEAAQIDGANSWQILWKITIPAVKPLAFIISIFSVVQLSTLPISNMYTMIKTATGRIDEYGHAAAYSVIYAILIILLIGIFALIFLPKNKKVKEKVTYTQLQQKKATLAKQEAKKKELAEMKKMRKAEAKAAKKEAKVKEEAVVESATKVEAPIVEQKSQVVEKTPEELENEKRMLAEQKEAQKKEKAEIRKRVALWQKQNRIEVKAHKKEQKASEKVLQKERVAKEKAFKEAYKEKLKQDRIEKKKARGPMTFKVFLLECKNFFTSKKVHRVTKKTFGYVLIYAILIIICYIFLDPFISMISKSFMTSDSLINPEVFYLPSSVTMENYRVAWQVLDYGKTLWNTVWYSGLLAIIQTLICAFAAYAFARFNVKYKKVWFAFLIVAFIVPSPVLLLPRQMMFTAFQEKTGIQMYETIIPTLLMTLLGQGVYSTILILIFFNFFKQIPYDLDEAAYMDGANSAQVLYHVILKLSLPVILTVFLFSFVWNWNESVMNNVFLVSKLILMPRKLGMFDTLFGTNGVISQINEGYQMAGTILSILPLIILYIAVQKKFIEGIEQTGLTGM